LSQRIYTGRITYYKMMTSGDNGAMSDRAHQSL
jgi:hypothetical protein